MADNNNIPSTNSGSFGVPGNYFASSAQHIINRIEWEEEHTEFPQLVALRTNPFVTPQEYEWLETSVETVVFQDLYSLRQHNTFEVPEHYFEASAYAIQSACEPDSSALYSVKRASAFVVPANYFNTTAEQLHTQLHNSTTGRVISLFRKASLAAAAVLFVVISFVGYRLYHQPVAEGDCGTIACLDRKELMQHQTLDVIDNEELFELVNPADLEKQLNGPDKKSDDSSSTLDELYEEELDS